jgi:hypothetical protein
MAIMPIEIINASCDKDIDIQYAIERANQIQNSFNYIKVSTSEANQFSSFVTNDVFSPLFFELMSKIREDIRGFHPFMIVIIKEHLRNESHRNLMISHRAKQGIGIITTCNIENIVIPTGRIHAYILYWLARITLNFIIPQHSSHQETRGCVFDFKNNKSDIIKSMRSSAFCDTCRYAFLVNKSPLSSQQFLDLDAMFAMSGKLLDQQLMENRKDSIFLPKSNIPDLDIYRHSPHYIDEHSYWTKKQSIHQNNLRYLRLQASSYGIDCPLYLHNQINAEQEAFSECTEQLQKLTSIN